MRTRAEIDADFVRMKEADNWIPVTGHTEDQERRAFNEAVARLMVDLEIDEVTLRLLGTRHAIIFFFEMQYAAIGGKGNP